ncbi:MAG: XdhC family protein [Gemmatimonadetes bacterium]|nr:MAG: XdhC family protein [Gemmatimonadota bacterium]
MSAEEAGLEVYRALLERHSAGRPLVLATVVHARGSTPRKAGACMLIDPEFGLVGSIGGGCGEAEVIRAADEALAEGRARLVHVDLTADLLSWSPAVCGGVMDVLVEPIGAVGPSEAGDDDR